MILRSTCSRFGARPLLVAVSLTGCLVASASAETSGDEDARRLAATAAEAAYVQGLDEVTGSSAALAAFRESADEWRRAIDAGADGPAAWFNLGNALLRAGEVGDAIVAYRRAERLDPTDDDVAANLAEARRRVDRPIQADATDLDFAGVASWWHVVGTGSRLWIAVGAWLVFWILLDRRLASGGRRADECEATTAAWRAGLSGSLVLAVVSAGTVAADRLLPSWRPVGVLVRPDVVLRSGNGTSFEPAIEEPLAEGVEFAILEDRPGWWRVRLPDGTTGWVSVEDGDRV